MLFSNEVCVTAQSAFDQNTVGVALSPTNRWSVFISIHGRVTGIRNAVANVSSG